MKRFHANGDFQCKVLFIHDAFFVIREELHLDIHTYVQYMPEKFSLKAIHFSPLSLSHIYYISKSYFLPPFSPIHSRP